LFAIAQNIEEQVCLTAIYLLTEDKSKDLTNTEDVAVYIDLPSLYIIEIQRISL